ncbi:hypothetical protein AMECASPLE_005223 [Ameca splendens]|uniref:Uncharacterized protein n=1 Tax=Ameca splendens TaxID=208324 RepID=A0ABV0ZJG6_9TELE
MTTLNWHAFVGTRKQTAAIFIALVSLSSLFPRNKRRGGEEVEQQPAAARRLKERKTEKRRPGLKIRIPLIRPPPPPVMGGETLLKYTFRTTEKSLFNIKPRKCSR